MPPPQLPSATSLVYLFRNWLKTDCVIASQPGLSEGGSWSLYSAADIIEKAQKTWSSLPSFFDWLPGIYRRLAKRVASRFDLVPGRVHLQNCESDLREPSHCTDRRPYNASSPRVCRTWRRPATSNKVDRGRRDIHRGCECPCRQSEHIGQRAVSQ
jgi:hypothetical protein